MKSPTFYRNLIAHRNLISETDKCYLFPSKDLLVLDEKQNVKKANKQRNVL